MANAARVRDIVDIGAGQINRTVAAYNERFSGYETRDVIRALLDENLLGRVAIVSSFGAESGILLHLVGSIQPHIPVLFLETGKHFPETLAYRDTLIARFGLTNVISLTPDQPTLDARDATGLRWSYDPDGCCAVRKVQPLEKALSQFDATITGRKSFQSRTRANLALFEADDGRIKFNPLAGWDKQALDGYVSVHNLPSHPLVELGYPSIGCAPCTSKVLPGEDPRAGRWRGWEKVECGIHTPVTMLDDPSIEPAF